MKNRKLKPSDTNNFDLKTRADFKRLYDTYVDDMMKLCVMKTGDYSLAGDVVQEIFEDLWTRRKTVKIKVPIKNYLMRATKFRLLAQIRDAKSQADHEACAYEGQDSYTEHQVSFNELQERVNTLVDRLPCQCKNVYQLSQEEGLSNKEIASRLLITEAAVSYHLKKAKLFLQDELRPHYNSSTLLIFMSLITSV